MGNYRISVSFPKMDNSIINVESDGFTSNLCTYEFFDYENKIIETLFWKKKRTVKIKNLKLLISSKYVLKVEISDGPKTIRDLAFTDPVEREGRDKMWVRVPLVSPSKKEKIDV